MLRGRATVFIACSDKFKSQFAIPVRQALDHRGFNGIILSEEPLLPWSGSDPDSKVDSYMNASDAFVALCTPDDRLDDGTIQTRQNIIDEHQRASQKPHLRSRILVFKESSVRLPSNINPTYEPLNINEPSQIADRVIRQLSAWGVLAEGSHSVPITSLQTTKAVHELIADLGLGDHEEATRRAYSSLAGNTRSAQQGIVAHLTDFLHESLDNEQTLLAASVLEAIARLDPSLVGIEIIEELAAFNDFSKRSSAAMLLWDRAEVSPAEVPLGLLGRLARPASEDWYVHAPAMATVKLLMLRRRPARIVFEHLAASADAQDRHAVAAALLDVAAVDAAAVTRDLAARLAQDLDELVAKKAQEVCDMLPEVSEGERDPFSPFGL